MAIYKGKHIALVAEIEVTSSGVDCTELYNLITANEIPPNTNERIIDYVGKLVGVTDSDTV